MRHLLPLALATAVLSLAGHATAQDITKSCSSGSIVLQNRNKGASTSYAYPTQNLGASYCVLPHTNPNSSLIIDCKSGRLSGALANGDRLPSAFRIVGNVKNVTIQNCSLTNYEQAVEIGLRTWAGDAFKGRDERDMYAAFNAGADTTALEDAIRARQTRYIKMVGVHISNVKNGVYVYPHSSFVTFSWGSVRNASGVALYLDSGTQQNWITDSKFVGTGGGREAIAVDSSAYNKILRNEFNGGWDGGVAIYRNCGENLFPRFQSARSNRIKHNHFSDLPFGVAIASRADAIRTNRKGTESYDNCHSRARKARATGDKPGECPPPAPEPQNARPYSWFCLGPSYGLPTAAEMTGQNIDPSTQSEMRMSWISPSLVSDGKLPESWYPRYSFYQDSAVNNVVRCNEFEGVTDPVVAHDDGAFIQNNTLRDSGNIVVGSVVRSRNGVPVRDVNVVGNLRYDLSGRPVPAPGTVLVDPATGKSVRDTSINSMPGIADQWGESETCE